MKFIKTYEGIFDIFKKKPDPYYNEIEYPTVDSYWKFSFLVKFQEDTGSQIKLSTTNLQSIIKCKKIFSDVSTDIYVFHGIWLDSHYIKNLVSFQHGTHPNYLHNEMIANVNEGDSFKKNFEIEKENWEMYYRSGLINNPFISVIKATSEEIEFFDFHETTNKYNL